MTISTTTVPIAAVDQIYFCQLTTETLERRLAAAITRRDAAGMNPKSHEEAVKEIRKIGYELADRNGTLDEWVAANRKVPAQT